MFSQDKSKERLGTDQVDSSYKEYHPPYRLYLIPTLMFHKPCLIPNEERGVHWVSGESYPLVHITTGSIALFVYRTF